MSTGIKASLPELRDAKKARFIKDYALSPYDAGVLVAEKETALFFETVAKGRDAKQAVQPGDRRLLRHAQPAAAPRSPDSPISAANLGKLLDLQADGTISGRIAKDLLVAHGETARIPAVLVKRAV
jgi:aspartyl-tRNA(Asn)/glutamyl-tRNA(Gln) amidotransferase subunit B